MMCNRPVLLLQTSVLLLSFLAAQPARGNPVVIVNGSFEAQGSLTGSTNLTGWIVVSGDVDTRGSIGPISATDGSFLLDLGGFSPAVIEQGFSGLTPGIDYSLEFDYGFHSGTTDFSVLLAGGGSISETLTATTTLESFQRNWTATGSSATLRFTDLNTDGQGTTGPLLDYVQIKVIPEPSTLLLRQYKRRHQAA